MMLESLEEISGRYRDLLVAAEWFFTGMFTVEYVVRILCARRPLQHVFSFYGVVDFLAIGPTYLMFLLPRAQGLAAVRALRLLRAFRIFKLAQMLSESQALGRASRSSLSRAAWRCWESA